MLLYGHPFSSYSWKAKIALYEKQIDVEFRLLDPDQPDNGEQLRALWPVGKFPLLVDGERVIFESTSIIDYLDLHYPQAPRLIPAQPEAALMVRHWDRIFDNHVMAPVQAVVGDAIRGPDGHVAAIVEQARNALESIYSWLDTQLAGRDWAAHAGFSLADCAAAPSLFYADWVYRIAREHAALRAYRARLLARPSVARCVEEARPYRALFPLGAPDRD